MPDLPSVALLGTGTMGTGMAHAMLRAGLPVTVWNRSADRAAPLEADGASVAATAEEAVADADVVLTMLFDTDAVAEVMEPLIGRLKPGAVWIQTTTVGRAGIARLRDLARPHGTPFVDAPMVGTKQPAEEGRLTVLASGPEGLRTAVAPVLDAIGARTVWVGDEAGAASALKLVANAWVAAITAATGQCIAMARGFDLDPRLFLAAMEGGAADSPYLHGKGEAIIDGRTDQAQFALDGMLKDIGLMRAAASEAGVGTGLIDPLLALYGEASATGHGSGDLAAIASVFRSDQNS